MFNTTLKLIILLISAFLALIICSGIWGLLSFVIKKITGHRVMSFKYLFFRYVPDTGFYTGKFSPICEILMLKENCSDLVMNILYFICLFIYSAIGAIMFIFVVLTHSSTLEPTIIRLFLEMFSLYYILNIIIRIFITIKTFFTFKNSLTQHTNDIIRKLQSGVPFGEIEIPDHRTYKCSASKHEIAHYLHFAFLNRVWHKNYETLPDIIAMIEKNINIIYTGNSNAFLMQFTSLYYDLLFYYSCMNVDYLKANSIFSSIEKDLRSDRDANGLRHLAYYTYFVLKDPETAEKLAAEGIEKVNSFPIVSLREYEELMLHKLLNAIRKGDTCSNYYQL